MSAAPDIEVSGHVVTFPRETMSEQREAMLKSADVARLLQVHPKQIYRLLARGLPAHRVGGEWRFSRDEVMAWSGMPSVAPSVSASVAAAASAAPAASASSPPPLLAANGDLIIEVLIGRLLAEDKPLVGLVQSDRGRALELLGAKRVLLAGFHGEVPPSHLGEARLARIHLVEREVGLAVGLGVKLRKVTDLAKKRVGLRPSTAGVRAHFDRALAEAGATLTRLHCKSTVVESHREAVCAVVRGDLDVALTTAAWAGRVGLGFLPLATEPYELLLYAENLGTPAGVGVCEVAQGRPFRALLAKVAGYDARRAGEIRYEG
jgi:excisionase family DNA binding protein